jgi:hypothetical protein
MRFERLRVDKVKRGAHAAHEPAISILTPPDFVLLDLPVSRVAADWIGPTNVIALREA